MEVTEKRFESDIEAAFLSPAGGYTKGTDTYDPNLGLYVSTLIGFVQATQPKEWARFEKQNQVDPVRKFCMAFNSACEMDGLLSVLRHGFKHRGITLHVCCFMPESGLNETAAQRYARNKVECYRQWYYSADTKKSVDMVLTVNGIPVFAFELKNQYTGQDVENAKRQWMYDRDPRELCFQFNKRILGFFCVDHTEVWMTTKLAGKDTYFLPFNQGSNGAGQDGGKGNPPNPDGYPTAYLWEQVFQKDKEFVFCSYLLKLLPAEAVDMIDLEGKLKLEYYKLQKTFEGTITLQEEKGVYEAAKQKGAAGQDPKEPLDEIIEKINEKYKGTFTESDRVLLNALHTKLMANQKLANMAKTSDPQIFAESIFPKAFGDAAQDSYMEAQDTYTALFEDQAKYNAIMRALAEVIYREMRNL